MEFQLDALSQEMLWLWHGDSSGNLEEECPPLEAGIKNR
jgi:hypothetical protein